MGTDENQILESQQPTIENTTIEIAQPTQEKKRWPKKLIVVLAASVVLLTLLFALHKSKPDESNFELWVKKEAAEKRGKTKNLVQKGVSVATQIQILATYKYSNYQIIAFVEAKANGNKMKFVGIANTWILLP